MTRSRGKQPDPPEEPSEPNSEERFFEEIGKRLDENPNVQAAEQALRNAKAEFDRARAKYREVRQTAAADLRDLRERNLGDWFSAAMEIVRKYPTGGVVAAALLGYVLGKTFHRK